MAAGRGQLEPEPGCVAHSDRGSKYTSSNFRAVVAQFGLRQSMGRTGSCYDSAACESLWAVLKAEIGTRIWPDRAIARAEVFEFIEVFYNRRRLRRHPPRLRLHHPGGDTRAAPAAAHVGSVRRTCPAQRGNFM